MNLRQLRTMVILAEIPSFAAAGAALGVSHSAVSLQVKSLEAELGVSLVDRSRRPPTLTEDGALVVERARKVISLVDEMMQLASNAELAGALSIGFVPTTLTTIAPPALALLRGRHEALRLSVRAGASAALAQQVRLSDLDLAITAAPEVALDGLRSDLICREPLMILAPPEAPEKTAKALLENHPFIWFDRRAWAGRQIERRIVELGFDVAGDIEIAALDGIAALVRNGLGVSIAPISPFTGPPAGLRVVPLSDPPPFRDIVLLRRESSWIERRSKAVLDVLRETVAKAQAET